MQRLALIVGGRVHEIVELDDDASIADLFHPSLQFVPANAAAIGWIWDGASLSAPEPDPISVENYRAAIQSHIDATVRPRNYDSGVTCASYVASTNPIWSAEAQAFVAWRDAVWVYAYAELAKVEAGVRSQPTVAAILAELPEMLWPA